MAVIINLARIANQINANTNYALTGRMVRQFVRITLRASLS